MHIAPGAVHDAVRVDIGGNDTELGVSSVLPAQRIGGAAGGSVMVAVAAAKSLHVEP
jgi:hypothetical protein